MSQLPIPEFFDAARVGEIWKVDYAARAEQARAFALQHDLKPAATSNERISLMLIDVQNTFCMPGFELFVGGRSGNGAVEDNIRLCQFIYRNLDKLTHIIATMDTHMSQQIFHPIFFIDAEGNHPAPYTDIHVDEVRSGKWKFNPALASQFNIAPEYGHQMVLHYAETLKKTGKYALTIWPYHAMLGGIGHAFVPAVEEAVFFHSHARVDQPFFAIKGDKPFTENYSVVGPEVLAGPMGEVLGIHDTQFIQHLQEVDKLYIAGQARSHCVAWTVQDLLDDILATDPELTKKVYLLEDCSSAVVVPGVVDHTEAANEAYAWFAQAGMHIVRAVDEVR
ncbi:MAG TPA: hypothetical protein PKL78_00550 [Anaerolineales bacterium]|nr:hypothetical protein [Anaerolineales bacterium]HNN12016.1 hypothetical protein [Anaerolineales bacterium]